MLDTVDLVHMNGRVYDPQLGRFLSADPLVQDPVNGQSYNRYSYVLNNPTNLTDPTGFQSEEKEIIYVTGSPISRHSKEGAARAAELTGTKGTGIERPAKDAEGGTVATNAGKVDSNSNVKVDGKNSANSGDKVYTSTLKQDPLFPDRWIDTAREVKQSPNYADQAMGNFINLNLAERGASGLGASERQAFWIGLGVSMIGNPKQVLSSIPKGGTYLLRNAEGAVMRTGRSKDLARRAMEHGRDSELKDLSFEVVHRTDVRSEQRGLEQMLHDAYDAPLNAIRPISPRNPRMDEYMEAARSFIERSGGQ